MPHARGAVLKPLVKLGRKPEDCWSWLGRIADNGCAMKQFHGALTTARRWLWSQLFGPIPSGYIVAATCGNGACTNPHHLRLCMMADAVRASPGTTLLPADVAELRACPFRSQPLAEAYADRFGVSVQTIRDVWARRSWDKPKLFKVEAA